MLDSESGIKFCGFYLYKKKINGYTRNITRMICFEDSFEDAERMVKGRIFNPDSDKIDSYYIVKYDTRGDIALRLEEFKLSV